MKRPDQRFLLFLILLFGLFPLYAQQEVRPSASDIVSLTRVSHLRLSPDGQWCVGSLTKTSYGDTASSSREADPTGWKTETQIFTFPVAGGEMHQYTNRGNASSPEWSPDGTRLAFFRREGGKNRIQIMPINGGEARAVNTGELEPTSFAWLPHGDSILFTAALPSTKEQKEAKRRNGGVEEFDHEWPSSLLWAVSTDGDTPRRITTGDEHVVDFALSPDGKRVALVLTASADPYLVYNLRTSRIISVADGSVIDTVSGAPAFIDKLCWSPDGACVAYATNTQSLSLLNTLRVHEVGRAATWDVTPSLELTIADLLWSVDSKSLLVSVDDRTISRLYRVPFRGGTFVECPLGGRVINSEIQRDRSGSVLLFLSSTHRDPADPTAYDLPSKKARVILHINPQVEQWAASRQEVVRWKNARGMDIEGLLATPDPPPTEPGPLMVLPHGGPDAVTEEGFSTWTRFFVAHGYAVFRVNYRGSLGYGYEFYAANRGKLGEVELEDIESGVDYLIAHHKADPKRLVYGGWSWGGYTTAWTIGHTNRYRAAVVGAGVIDVASAYVTSDINHGVAAQWEYKGDPWRQTEHFDRSSPHRFLKNAVTPTLILHGRNDTRVSFTQGMTLYRALKDVGCETKFYAYPRENHGFGEPAHIVHMMNAWLDWYREHLPR